MARLIMGRMRDSTPTTIRLDVTLREALVQAALVNHRTFTAELERRLWQSFQAEGREAKVRKGAK